MGGTLEKATCDPRLGIDPVDHVARVTSSSPHAVAIACRFAAMHVRAALREDLDGITGLLYGDYFRDMAELLEPEAITAFVETEFAPARLKRSVLLGGLFVAEDGQDLLGFAIADHESDHLELRSICTRSMYIQQGVAKRLLDEVQHIAPDLPVSATVILGNIPAETFHESQGFVPGEVDDREVGGQHIVERRWWRNPGPDLGSD